jgi:hypothetical protein
MLASRRVMADCSVVLGVTASIPIFTAIGGAPTERKYTRPG